MLSHEETPTYPRPLRAGVLPLALYAKHKYNSRELNPIPKPSGRPLVKVFGSEPFFDHLDRFYTGRQGQFELWLWQLFQFVSLREDQNTSAHDLRGYLTRIKLLSIAVSESELRAERGKCKQLALRTYVNQFFDGELSTFCEWLDDLFVYLAVHLPYAEDLTRTQRYHASRIYHLLMALEEIEIVNPAD